MLKMLGEEAEEDTDKTKMMNKGRNSREGS
jgi:hypothetical protein